MPSPGESAGEGVLADVSCTTGGLDGAGVRAVVGVPFAVAGPEAPLTKGGMRPEDVDNLDARDPGRRGEEAIFLGSDAGCEGGEGKVVCVGGAIGEEVGNGV